MVKQMKNYLRIRNNVFENKSFLTENSKSTDMVIVRGRDSPCQRQDFQNRRQHNGPLQAKEKL